MNDQKSEEEDVSQVQIIYAYVFLMNVRVTVVKVGVKHFMSHINQKKQPCKPTQEAPGPICLCADERSTTPALLDRFKLAV